MELVDLRPSHTCDRETKKESKLMIKKESRKGFALGAIVALLASMFGASVPAYAAATEGANIAVRPWAGPATNLNGLLTEDFSIYAGLGVAQSNSNWKTVSEVVDIVWEVTETTGLYDVVVASANTYSAVAITVSSLSMDTAGVLSNTDGAIPSVSGTVDPSAGSNLSTARTNQAQELSAVSISAKLNATSNLVHLGLRAVTGSAITSESPNAVVTVKIWIDEVGGKNGVHDADEWYTVETVTLHASSRVPVTTTVTGVTAGSDWLTVSATVGGLNYENLGGKYYVYAETHDTADSASKSSALSGAVVAERSGVLTHSWALSSLSELTAISVSALYDPSGAGATTLSAFALGSVASNTAAPGDADAVSISIDDDGVNVTGSYKVRLNQSYTVRVGSTTASTSVSGTAISVAFSGVDLVQFVKEIRVNGGAWTSSLPAAVAVTTGADGWATFTYETRGFVDGNDLTLTATATGALATATVEAESTAYTVHNDYQTYAGAPGGAVTVTYQIRDQWNVLSTQDHKLVLTKGGTGFNYAATDSEVTTSTGKASFTFTPEPATATGSATVAAVGYVKDTNGAFVTSGVSNDGNVTIYVGSSTDAFLTTDAIAGSYSVSVSYFPSSLSWTSAITGAAANSGSVVTVAAAGVIFKDAVGNTASDAISVRVGTDQLFTVYATSETSGTYTMTFTNGTTTTTSLLIVSAPGSDQGVSIVWDTTEIQAGKTKVVTGTLLDAAGNPVYTDNKGSVSGTATTASILVTYTGTAGIPVGTMPTETDVDGKFRVSILTSAADSGTFTLTAVYSKDGTVTADDDKLTSVQTITVGEVAAAASDKKVNAGSFKGYVAVYAKGYEGQRLSAKVGNDWVVVASLASNFERVVEFTGAGYTIAVRIYIDRVLVDTITVTTK